MFKPCLPCQAIGMFRCCRVHTPKIVAVIAEQIENTMFVYTGICPKIIAIDRLEIIKVWPVIMVTIGCGPQAIQYLVHTITSGNISNDQNRCLRNTPSVILRISCCIETVYLFRIGIVHLTLNFNVDIAVLLKIPMVYSYTVEQEIRQIVKSITQVVTFRLIFPFHTAGIKKHGPPCFQS